MDGSKMKLGDGVPLTRGPLHEPHRIRFSTVFVGFDSVGGNRRDVSDVRVVIQSLIGDNDVLRFYVPESLPRQHQTADLRRAPAYILWGSVDQPTQRWEWVE